MSQDRTIEEMLEAGFDAKRVKMLENEEPGFYLYPLKTALDLVLADINKGKQIIQTLKDLGDYSVEDVSRLLMDEFPMFVPLEDIVVSFTRQFGRAPDRDELNKTMETAQYLFIKSGIQSVFFL